MLSQTQLCLPPTPHFVVFLLSKIGNFEIIWGHEVLKLNYGGQKIQLLRAPKLRFFCLNILDLIIEAINI